MMIANSLQGIAILFCAGLLCFAACAIAMRILPPDFLAAKQTSRSNHAGKPRQLGGLALVPSTFAVAATTLPLSSLWQPPSGLVAVALVMAFLLGLADDWKGLGVKIRLAVQLAIAAILVTSSDWLDAGFLIYVVIDPSFGIYVIILATFCLIATTYWINAVNFMDGLDWLLVGGLTLPLIFHALLLAHTGASHDSGLGLLALCAAGSLVGFGFWNRPPARLFLGDSGSLFLGALTAATILQVSTRFGLLVAITPVLYFLADTASTLFLRLHDTENILQAHSRHAYQQAYRNGRTAIAIAIRIALFTGFLVSLSVLMLVTTGRIPQVLFAGALMTTAAFILLLRKPPSTGK